MAQKRRKVGVDYLSTDFNSIKNSLVEYAKRYYENSNKDFSENSFGSMVTDMTAYVGDILSYYLTYSVNESFLDSALEYQNVIKIGRSLGYKFKGVPTSYGVLTTYVMIPSDGQGRPDIRYFPTLMKGSRFSSNGGASFTLRENIDFSKSDNEIIVAAVNDNGSPASYAVKSFGTVLSGDYNEEIISIGSFQKFLKVRLSGQNIAEVLEVVSQEGDSWYETETLSQNVVWKEINNVNAATDGALSILKPITVPRRFSVEQDGNGNTFLQFGASSGEDILANNILDPTNTTLQLLGRDYISDTSFDPSELLTGDGMGIAPSNTQLRVLTRNLSIQNSNAAQNSITEVTSPIFEFRNRVSLNTNTINSVVSSLEVLNDEPILGAISLPTSEELKLRIEGNYASQDRCVTGQDFKAAIYNMPAKFGAIRRCNVMTDINSFKRNLNIYLVSENSDGTLVAPSNTIKQNLKNWLASKKLIGDTVDLLPAIIVNVGINFEIVAQPEKNKFSVLQIATDELISQLSTVQDIGQSFDVSAIYQILKNIPEVLDCVSVNIINKNGGNYSDVSVNIDQLLDPSGRFVRCPNNVIFEIKYLRSDIQGSVS